MADTRIGKCCCGEWGGGTVAVWSFAAHYEDTGYRADAFLIGTSSAPFTRVWLKSMSDFALYPQYDYVAESYAYVVNGGAGVGFTLYPYSIDGDNILMGTTGIRNKISRTTDGEYPIDAGIALFRNRTCANATEQALFLDDYNNGFTPRLVEYATINEWLDKPAEYTYRVYAAVNFNYASSGSGSGYAEGRCYYYDFTDIDDANAYLATL